MFLNRGRDLALQAGVLMMPTPVKRTAVQKAAMAKKARRPQFLATSPLPEHIVVGSLLPRRCLLDTEVGSRPPR